MGTSMGIYLPVQPPSVQSSLQDSCYRYREFEPSEGLDSHIVRYWTVRFKMSDRGSKLHRIIPDGCVDLITDLRASDFSQGAFVTGLMTAYETMELNRDCHLFGIRFFADKLRRFIRCPVAELVGSRVFLDQLWGPEARILVEKIQQARDAAEAIRSAESVLLGQLSDEPVGFGSKASPIVHSGLRFIYDSQGMGTVRTLAEELGYSERSVRRFFNEELGVGPKEMMDIVRFQSFLKRMPEQRSATLTDMALRCGYYDQPHFIHSFKRYYGLLPHQVFS